MISPNRSNLVKVFRPKNNTLALVALMYFKLVAFAVF